MSQQQHQGGVGPPPAPGAGEQPAIAAAAAAAGAGAPHAGGDHGAADTVLDELLGYSEEMEDEEEELDWEEEDVDAWEEAAGMLGMLDDVDEEEDGQDSSDWEMTEDEEDEHLGVAARAALECGVLRHDASFLQRDQPLRHAGVPSSTCHYQTADALTFLPRPASAAPRRGGAAAGGADEGEEVLVSDKATLSAYRLAPGQPAQLLARAATCYKHYSIAASPCGNFVAASGNQGLLTVFRVRRGEAAAAAAASGAAVPPGAAAAAAKGGGGGDGEGEGGAQELPWKLEHVATLLCANSREAMVNSVRFGRFAGRMRLLVAHQDGMLYLFNLPGDAGEPNGAPAPAATAAGPPAPAAAAPGGAAGSGSAPAPAPAAAGSELMVHGLPDWEPLGSQVNRRFAEQMLALLAGHHNHQPEDEGDRGGPMAVDEQPQQEPQEPQQQEPQQQEPQQQQYYEQPDPPSILPGSSDGGPPGSLGQLTSAIAAAERLLSSLAQDMGRGGCAVAARLAPHFAPGGAQGGGRPLAGCSWLERARLVAQLLQDDTFLEGLREFQELRLLIDMTVGMRALTMAKGLRDCCEGLRLAAGGQRALLGLLGARAADAQWRRQLGEGDGAGRAGAAARAGYCLLLLRLMAPGGVPSMKQSARVLLLRHGPGVDAAARLFVSDARAAPHLATCAISNIAPDVAKQQRAAAMRRMADRLAAQAQAEGAPPEAMAAAQVAAHDAQAAAAEQQVLPLNIAEASPDGRWLVVGVDQAAVLLLPAGKGYQHQPAQVLDLCPLLPPQAAQWQQQGTLGVQYVSFNASSTLVAATSDHLHMAAVFEVATGQLLASFALHNRPVLPVRFLAAPHDGEEARQQEAERLRGGEEPPHPGAGAGLAFGVREVDALLAGVPPLPPGPEAGGGAGGDRLLVYCESAGGVHIADLGTFKAHWEHREARPAARQGAAGLPRPPGAPAPPPLGPGGPQARSAQQMRSHFCIKSYLELPPEEQPQAQQGGAGGAAEAPPQPQPQAPAAAVQLMQQQAPGPAMDVVAGGGGGGGGAHAAGAAEPQQQRINGLAVTPAGRVLVACKGELMEWSLLTSWSQQHHVRFPPRFREAVRLLLLAAAHPGSAADAEGGGGVQGVSQLPGVVLERIIARAAVPQAAWASAATPAQSELFAALRRRPRIPVPPLAGGAAVWQGMLQMMGAGQGEGQ